MAKLIVVDVESDGPIPGPDQYSMVCFAAVVVDKQGKFDNTFYGKTRPISNKYDKESLSISGFSREEHEKFDDPLIIMQDFDLWLREQGKCIFISDNPCLKCSTRIKVTEEFSFLPSYKKHNKTVEIYDIVKNKVSLKIPTFNLEKNKIEYNRIIDWQDNEPKDKWVKIKTSINNNYSSFTENHKIFIKGKGYIEASELNIGDIVLQYDYTPNDDQKQLIYGSLLGDSSTGRKGKRGKLFITGHVNESYRKYKKLILGDLCSMDINPKRNNRGFSKSNGILSQISSKVLRILKDVDKKKKNYSDLIDLIDYRGLAVWYMDDGSLLKNTNLRLHTEGHDLKSNLEIANKLSIKTGLNWKVVKADRGKHCLILSKNDTSIFCEKIHPFVIKELEYKLIPKYRNLVKYQFNNKIEYDVFEEEVLDVLIEENKEIKRFRKRNYCITVENNNNFFTTIGLVHNCYDWQFINYYLHKYIGRNHFGYSGQRIGDKFQGYYNDPYYKWKKHRDSNKYPHNHDPLSDAKGNASALLYLYNNGYNLF